MRIFSRGTLREFWEKNPGAKSSLEFWYDTIKRETFYNPNQVLSFFRNADTVGNGRIVFNIAHNKFRLVAKFHYEIKTVYVRFIGTHREYDQIEDMKNI